VRSVPLDAKAEGRCLIGERAQVEHRAGAVRIWPVRGGVGSDSVSCACGIDRLLQGRNKAGGHGVCGVHPVRIPSNPQIDLRFDRDCDSSDL
jgi:hypothetical protein